VAGLVAVGVLDVEASAVGTGEGLVVVAGADLRLGDSVAVMAGRSAEGTAETEAEAVAAGGASGVS
jgi:hypothetical protein